MGFNSGFKGLIETDVFHCYTVHVALIIDMYMSYRWRENFNTVRSPSDRDVITTGIDMCWRRMRKGGGGGDGPYIRRGAD